MRFRDQDLKASARFLLKLVDKELREEGIRREITE